MKLWFERGAWASKRGRHKIAGIKPEDVKRIAVIRHAALGDMVLVRPFLIEARKFFPNAEIVLSLVSNYTYGAPTDLVDSVHILHGSDQKRASFKERIARARELGEVDILFDLANTTRSRYLCLLTPAKIKIGFPYWWYIRNLFLDAAVHRSDFSFEAINMLDALMLLGANPGIPPNFAWPKEIADIKVEPPNNSVVYFPFASVASKCWPKTHFMQLIDQAAKTMPDYEHVILAGVKPEEQVTDYQSLADAHHNVRLQNALDLDAATRMLAATGVVVSNDTGVRNLAISLDTPTLGIFFSTVPYRYWPRYGNHQAVFNADGSMPAVQSVLQTLVEMTKRH
ncbi:MAG: glycosyltransferase family 9 protein [Burkholderiaceae bacterium]|nr:glycosyltransferase family 9 protein [Burkholderiaceae bacterium]